MRAAGYFSWICCWAAAAAAAAVSSPSYSVPSASLSLSSPAPCASSASPRLADCWIQCADYFPLEPFPAQHCFLAWPLADSLSWPLLFTLGSHSPKWLWTPGYSETCLSEALTLDIHSSMKLCSWELSAWDFALLKPAWELEWKVLGTSGEMTPQHSTPHKPHPS